MLDTAIHNHLVDLVNGMPEHSMIVGAITATVVWLALALWSVRR
ncbi:hypothetical protein [Mesorhizobium sp.]|nr:hypothetical protein [Mesorhizobium sp.]